MVNLTLIFTPDYFLNLLYIYFMSLSKVLIIIVSSLQAWCMYAHLQTGIHMRKDFADGPSKSAFSCCVWSFGSSNWELFLKVCPQHDYYYWKKRFLYSFLCSLTSLWLKMVFGWENLKLTVLPAAFAIKVEAWEMLWGCSWGRFSFISFF